MKFFFRVMLVCMLFPAVVVQVSAQAGLQEVFRKKPQYESGIIENKGQITDQNGKPRNDVKYIYAAPGFKAIFKENSFSYELFSPNKTGSVSHVKGKDLLPAFNEKPENISFSVCRLDITLAGASKTPILVTEGKSSDYNNYFLAHTPQEGIQKVHSYTKLTYKNIWPNIDIVFYASDNSKLKYDIMLHPGADIKNVQLIYSGAENIQLLESKLKIFTAAGTMEESIPRSYQPGTNENVNISFVKNNTTVSFAGNYDHTKTLVIDPELRWSTYFGDTEGDRHTGLSVDKNSNVYFCGYTPSLNVIATSGAYQTTYNGGGADGFVEKFDKNGKRKWGTYYGGADTDLANSIATDSSSNVYITGVTNSTSGISTSGSHQPAHGGNGDDDTYIVKFDSTGKRKWATYFGNNGSEWGNDITCDAAGNIYMTGYTHSTSGIASSSAYQTSRGGGGTFISDAFLVKFNTSGTRLWATYFGGDDVDQGYGVSCDASGNVFITGHTYSNNAIASSGAHQTVQAGDADAFIAKFNSSGTKQWSTYFGKGDEDCARKVTCDASGNVFITGYTNSTSGMASSTGHQKIYDDKYDAFVAKFNSSGTRQWSTYYGGSEIEWGYDVACDKTGNLYLVGSTRSTNAIATTDALQTANAGYMDAFLVKFTPDGKRVWGTYYGGDQYDYGFEVCGDIPGNIYVGGETYSFNALATTGAFQDSLAGSADVFIAKFNAGIDIVLDSVINLPAEICQDDSFKLQTILRSLGSAADAKTKVTAMFTGADTLALTDTLDNIIASYSKETLNFSKYLKFTKAGDYDVKIFIATPDVNAQNDTFKSTLKVNARADVNFIAHNTCVVDSVYFIDSTIINGGSIAAYSWDFGDGKTSSLKNPANKYAKSGYYEVKLMVETLNGCKDSVVKTISVYAAPNALLTYSNTCLNKPTAFTNNSTIDTGSISQFIWNFGDGDTSSAKDPLHLYDSAGTYFISLKVISAFGCADSVIDSIVILPSPTASFSTNNVCIKDDASFTDASQAAIEWLWDFGDSSTSTIQNPTHKYFSAGTYMVKLKVKNANGCTDTVSQQIEIYDSPEAIFSINDICVTDSFSITDASKGAEYWFWDFGDGYTATLQHPKHKYEKGGNYTIYLTVSNSKSCISTVSHNIFVDSTCVWPGDANADKIVDNYDILAIGIAYGDTGAARLDTSTLWKGNIVKDWNRNFTVGANYKHADSDGNGTISNADTSAVTRNYTKTHAKKNRNNRGKSTDPVLKIDIQNDSLTNGDTLVAYILFGENALPASNVYGLAFSLDYNQDQLSFLEADFAGSWLGKNILFFSKQTDRLDIALTRTDQADISGFGRLATVKMIVKKDADLSNGKLKMDITDNKIISAREEEIPINIEEDSVQIYEQPNSIASVKNISYEINVYPNPFSSATTVAYNLQKNAVVRLSLVDISGKCSVIMPATHRTKGNHQFILNTEKYNLPSGMYILLLEVDGMPVYQRIMKMD